MRFFFDNCISSNLTAAMRLLNEPHHAIEHLTERFPPDTLDEIWLPALAHERSLIIVSADPAITSSRKEKEIWRRTGLTSFFMGGGFADKNHWVQTLELVRWWPAVLREAKSATRGTGFLLPLKGSDKPKVFYAPLSAGG